VLERLVVEPVRGTGLDFHFFAHGVDLPPPRAAVYFIRAISPPPLSKTNGVVLAVAAYPIHGLDQLRQRLLAGGGIWRSRT
jgi:hypothetical protein